MSGSSRQAVDTVASKAKKCGGLERDLELIQQQIDLKRQNRQTLLSSLEAEIVNLQRRREAIQHAHQVAEAELEDAIDVLVQGGAE